MGSKQSSGVVEAFVSYTNVEQEYFFAEGCHITELSNSEADPELSVARARVEPGVTTRWHRLQGISERYVILAGNGLVEVGERLIESVTAGDVVVIPPGVPQRIANRGDSDLVFLALCTPRFVESAYEDLEEEPIDAPAVDRAAPQPKASPARAVDRERYEVLIADYHNPQHAGDIVALMDEYGRDPMGKGSALGSEVLDNLVAELAGRPHAFSLLCYDGDIPVGVYNCFENFSTFAGKPFINLHDGAVAASHRGQNISYILHERLEEVARERGCCKITAEIAEDNHSSHRSSSKAGLRMALPEEGKGRVLFWEKFLE